MSGIQHPSRTKLIDAAVALIREKGYAATTVDDICVRSGVKKGSFFHHFKSKEDLVLATIGHWNQFTHAVFESAPYQALPNPRERLLAYVDFRIEILADRDVTEFTCLLGTLVQETYATHPAIRAACDFGMSSHIDLLTRDIAEARALYAPGAAWSAESVGYFIQSVLQGAFIFSKAKEGPAIAEESLQHVKAYLIQLFPKADQQRE